MNSLPSQQYQTQPWRLWVIYGVVTLVMGSLLFRLINLQVIQGIDWFDQAVENYTTTNSIPPARGIIYDRNGYILAGNIASYSVVITPANLPDSDADIQNIYRDLSGLIDVPATQGTIEEAKLFAECVPGPGIEQLVALGESLAPYRPVKVKCDVDEEIARMVRELAVDWPGVSVEIDPIRDYPTGSLTANVVGFLGPIPASLEEEYRTKDLFLTGIKLDMQVWRQLWMKFSPVFPVDVSFRSMWQGRNFATLRLLLHLFQETI